MPAPVLRSLAKKHGVSTKSAEKAWDRAMALSKQQYGDIRYGVVTHITKNILKAHAKKQGKKKAKQLASEGIVLLGIAGGPYIWS